jgi:hydrogenase maturation protein HypF
MTETAGIRIHITGVVQGVGFRPFVYTLATRLALTGWVRNTSAGVDIEVDGPSDALQAFVEGLQKESPPLSHIDDLIVEERPVNGYTKFEILHSQPIADAFQPISPDISICPDCLRELFDPDDRRYRYPFINCTNCGPRFTIIEDIPYDRPKTTMAGFELCTDCAEEYDNPLDRRFHAQPVACPECGPQVWIEPTGKPQESPNLNADAAIWAAQRLLAQGKIVAIKGLGGFHLACDATNPIAVAELRHRKLRVDKPFALMMPDLETVQQHCFVNEAESSLLESRERPIVILRRRPESTIAAQVAPQQDTLGVMLPYTPLHYLLLYEGDHPAKVGSTVAPVLVMTSGNISEEPIATENDEARERLGPLADAFLLHNRPIRTRCDDSVMRVFRSELESEEHGSALMPLRRSRGYAPFPVRLPWDAPPLLAAGAELKNTFCITRGTYAFLSHHIGDLENYETLESFQDGVEHFERLFRIRPQALVYDLHPNYLATRYAQARAERDNLPAIGVQHHHAHIAACMVEHGLSGEQPVIGVAFDGTGYGDDGAIWGGEFLLANYQGYRRAAHLVYVPLPGGDAAIRKPARTALAHLWHADLDWDPKIPSPAALCVEERTALRSQLEKNINAPLTSSMGRLFDAAAALSGVRQKVNYEAQAAIEFEALVNPDEKGAYDFELYKGKNRSESNLAPLQVDPAPLIASLCADQLAGVPLPILAARFHNGVARMVVEVCRHLRTETNLDVVALSGGVWQNMVLLAKTVAYLEQAGFTVLLHHQVPSNDGGLALGQAAIAADYFTKARD